MCHSHLHPELSVQIFISECAYPREVTHVADTVAPTKAYSALWPARYPTAVLKEECDRALVAECVCM